MPPSGRKGKTRVRRAPAAHETHEHSEAETPEGIPTPSRGSRKRTRGSEITAPVPRSKRNKVKDTRADREDTEGTETHEQSDNDTEPSPPTEQEIVASLKVSDRHVNATEDFANDLLEGQENVPGYGKIAGRDWVFIIRKVEVNIGRPEAQERLAAEGEGRSTPSSRTVVDIDLGPDRQISRLHASITYDPGNVRWFIIVNGRNGLRVDNNLCKRGSKTYLRNGSVIEIANTQMAFITTATEDSDGPIWDASIIRQAQKSSEEDDDGDEDTRNNGTSSHPHLVGRSHLQDQGMYQSDYSGQQQPGQQPGQQRTHPHSQHAAVHPAPGTPMRSQPRNIKSSPAANYARGIMMESTESLDYAGDGAKDLKPPHSYAQLIGMAILSGKDQQMTLSNIYKFIMANYAFYRFNTGGWQNSIRHNLSLNKAFTKIARRTDEPGKGMKWMIEPTEYDSFVQQGMKGCRRPNPMLPCTQSTLGSPTSPMDRARPSMKRDDDATPPMHSYQPAYPTAMEAYTPDRGPKRPTNGDSSSVGLGIDGNGLIDYDYPHRSTPRHGLNATANAAGSPPALYVNDDGHTGALDTPFPLRASQRLAPPSTLRRPSDFIQFSSPAPFWKMEGLNGSTPFKPFDLSPLKTPFPSLKKGDTEAKKSEEVESSPIEQDETSAKDGERKSNGSPVISSSSPPRHLPADNTLEGSPTISRPATAVAKTLSQLANAEDELSSPTEKTPPNSAGLPVSTSTVQQHTPPATVTQASQPAPRHELPQTSVANSFESARPMTNGGFAGSLPNGSVPQATGYQADDGDDEGFDLVKGFQPIGAFHQRNHLAMGMGAYGR